MDEVGLVHGPVAEAALRTAAEQLGGHLERTALRSVDHRPGRGATAVHDVRVRLPSGPVDHVLALTTDVSAVDGAPGTLVLTRGGSRLGVWRLPHDPSLPGLLPALDPAAVAGLLSTCGVPSRPDDVTLQLRSYRPRRRAVVEAGTDRTGLFLKVVPPEDARALHERHRELATAGVPAARSLGYDPRGVVVLERLGGRTWRRALREGLASPSAEDLWRAVDRLPDRLLETPRRPSWAEQSWHHVELLCAARPDAATEVRALAEAADVAQAVASLPLVPVHGDLYEAQVMVVDGRLSGLLDLDTAGPGHRVDDEACVLAHLALLPLAHPDATAACSTAFHQHLRAARSDPEVLWRRMALVLLTLATGPARNRRPGWQRRTDQWLALPRVALGLTGDRPWTQDVDLLPRLLAAARHAG
ncbi:aminoglycoside phosphotransferase family protein [Aquipuribacter sp. MA13-6]|uniref:aminoglycoside phosphotransferase family protein n=1 Tax=unclassified Aquipuribacter TaxID=2635084 RepID=UPI003EEF9365